MSQIQLNPYINFQGRAREAFEFYHEVFGGTLDLQPANGPGGDERITNGQLAAEGVVIAGTDGHPDYPAQLGDAMALALSGTDAERIGEIFNRLGEGGTIKMPLRPQPWGGQLGWLTDQFGINWMVSISPA